MKKLMEFCVNRPKAVTGVMAVITVGFLLVAILPTIWPNTFNMLHPLSVDTDPEHMLPEDETVRIFHNRLKKEFSLHDIIVLGIVNDSHPEGVFNTQSLKKIYALAEFAKTLHWPDEENSEEEVGVIEVDLIAPSTVDNIEHGGPGVVKFEWLIPSPPNSEKDAVAIRQKAERIPFLNGTMLSEDGKAMALYLPITSKDITYDISKKLKEKIASFSGDERYYITGLPVAEDTFGVEMFKQMAITAPIAMFVIFFLLLFFFHNLVLIISPLIVAMVSVISTMGLLIATGNTVHIMSSMIPIFIMPIAVLNAVHILSYFFDRYQETKDRRKTILKVMDTLSTPMLFTTLTTAVGFSSLALTPIPPVQVFGLFIAFGVISAWFWTITFIPAYIMLIPEKSFANFGLKTGEKEEAAKSRLTSFLSKTGLFTFRHPKLIMAVTAAISVVAVYEIFQINISDNPVKWVKTSHPIRVADKVIERAFWWHLYGLPRPGIG